MTALAVATPRTPCGPGVRNDIPVKSGVQIYEGGAYAIELATGKLYVPVGNTAAEVFAGISQVTVLGDGFKTAQLIDNCPMILDVTGVDSWDDFGKTVYATNDGTFSLTDTGSDLPIGSVFQWITGTTCVVWIKSKAVQAP